MKININIDNSFDEISVNINAPEMNKEVESILSKLQKQKKVHVLGSISEKIFILMPNDILFFYSENRKVFANTFDKTYEVKEKLYELEELLGHSSFIRISKSTIANVDTIKNIEMSFNGTLCATFINEKKEYVSRNYVSKIKDYLGL